MSVSLSVERDRIQRQVEELEHSLSATYTELELLSSETGDESEEEEEQSAAGLLAQRDKIQNEIQNLENVLGPHSPIIVSDDDSSSSSSEESELGLSPSAESCLQMNLVYQQVVQETLDQLETLLTLNHRQQKELVSQLSGPIKESSRERPASSSCQQPISMYLGRFLKPYFKDKLTGLGPPANQETKEKASRMTGCLDDKKLKVKQWKSWQKTLLIHAVTRDSLRRLIQPKLSKVDYLSQKLSAAVEADRQQLMQQIDSLEREIDLLRGKSETELIGGDRYDEHDWQKIANVDFEGTRDADDIRSFWQNFLHPSINKTQWSREEVQRLKEISRRHGERHWESIAAELGTGRTAFLCLQTFQRFVSNSLKRGGWTSGEDALLRELVDKMRIGNFIPYTQMSYFMEGRDPAQLIYRWNQVLDPSLKKGFWTKEEDQLLLKAVSRFGEKDWWKIRFEVPGRTDSSCRDRYYDCLKAETKRGPFDQQERQLLIQLVNKHGVGRWAKIAAEIPHRNDAQCLREWRKLSKPAPPPPAKKNKRTRKRPTSHGGVRGRKKASPAKKNIKRRLMGLKVESSEDEGMLVYMDSDEEKEKKKKELVEEDKEEEEKEGEEYTIPPMQEWIPVEEAQSFTNLSFRSVELLSSGVAHNQVRVRSTILGRFGRSVIIGPRPRELQWAESHSSSTMMMVSPDQLQTHLHRQAQNFDHRSSGRRGKIQMDKQSPLGRVTDIGLGYELQAAVTPWIGNLLIPPKHRLVTADALRERGEKTPLPSTPLFLLLLQTLYVDAMGCKEMIEQRRKRVGSVDSPPPPHPSPDHKKTVAALLQQRRDQKKGKQPFDQEHKLILKQLQALQQQQKQKQQQLRLKLQPPPPPLPPRPPSMPGVPHHMPPWIPHPVTQPHASSIQLSLNMPPPAPRGSPPVGLVTSPLLAPRRPSVPPVTGVPAPLNATSTGSASSHQEAAPLIQSLTAALHPSPNRHASLGSSWPSQHATPSTSSSPNQSGPAPSPPTSSSSSTKGMGQKVAEVHTTITEGWRIQKPSQKAKALQEATEAKAGAKKKAGPSSRKRTRRTSVPVLPQTTVPVPPQTPSLRLNVPPFSVNSSPLPLNATPACSDRSVSSTQNLSLAPPPSIPTNHHLASSTSSLPLPDEHDYTSFNLQPSHHGSNSTQPSSDSTPNQPPKAPPSRRRKRGRGEVQLSVTSSQDNQCVGGTSEAVGGTSDAVGGTETGVILEGKRVRHPTERLRALQEATEAKAEAKKKRASSSPCKKRSRTSRPQEEVVVQDQPVTQPNGLCLLRGQLLWVMTPRGLVQLALVPSTPLPAPPVNHQLATPPLQFTDSSPQSAPPPTTVSVPVNLPVMSQPRPFPAPPTSASKPLFLPYKATVEVKVDPASPPPLRREALQFDPSLMFLESQEAVCDWLSGRGGVVVPGVGVALPYLPPFVSSLSMLSSLLRAKKSLIKSSLQLLSRGSERRRPSTTPKPDSGNERTSSPPPDLPDSTSDLSPAQDTPAPSISPNLLQEEKEEELVVVARQLVAERFSGNPAYQLLKARFLSCFTVPALLATVQPIREKTVASPANEEEEKEKEEEEEKEKEEEEELKKIKERGRRRRAERSLLCDGSGAPASHFSGILTNKPGPAQTGPDQTRLSVLSETTDLKV